MMHGKKDLGTARLKGLRAQINDIASSRFKNSLLFTICRFHALGSNLEGSYVATIRDLNEAIYSCPVTNLGSVNGLSETLLMLAEAYNLTGRYEEAMHSVCLSMDFAMERLVHTDQVS